MAHRVEFELMRPQEIAEARARCPLAFIPVGPLEWHGPHLPLGTDGLIAHAIAVEVATRTGGVVLPAFFVGTDTLRPPGGGPQSLGALGFADTERVFGMDLPQNPVKSLYFEEGVFSVVVREVIRLLKADGYRLLVLLSGHGAPNHLRALQRLAAEESDPPRVRVELARSPRPPAHQAIDPGHAEKLETSVMMAVRRDCVDTGTLPPRGVSLRYRDYGIVNGKAFDGDPTVDFTLPPTADPRDASEALGREAIEARVTHLVEITRRWIEAMAQSPRQV